mmetsp:Transcript_8825/g.25689  ORF Transcript_8825/g.25689 Transcript_8825/m.25689 type:complete len:201 (+) Transcript_8825:597-1199(+)
MAFSFNFSATNGAYFFCVSFNLSVGTPSAYPICSSGVKPASYASMNRFVVLNTVAADAPSGTNAFTVLESSLEYAGSSEEDFTGALPIIRSGSSSSFSSFFFFIAVASTLIGLGSVKGFATGSFVLVSLTSQVELSLFSSNIFFSRCALCALLIASWNSFRFSASVESSPTSAKVKLSSESLLPFDEGDEAFGLASLIDA